MVVLIKVRGFLGAIAFLVDALFALLETRNLSDAVVPVGMIIAQDRHISSSSSDNLLFFL